MSEQERRQARDQASALAAAGQPKPVRQQQRPEVGAPGSSGRIACIVRSVDFAETITVGQTSEVNPDYGKMAIQRVVYTDKPPVMGNIVVKGPIFDAYPIEGADPEGYDVGLYPEFEDEPDANGDPIPIPFPPANQDWVYCRMAERRGGFWIVENPFTAKAGIRTRSIAATQSAAGSV